MITKFISCSSACCGGIACKPTACSGVVETGAPPTSGSCRKQQHMSSQRTRYNCMDQEGTAVPRHALSGSISYFTRAFPGPPELFGWPPREGDGPKASWEWTGWGSLCPRNAWTPLLCKCRQGKLFGFLSFFLMCPYEDMALLKRERQ